MAAHRLAVVKPQQPAWPGPGYWIVASHQAKGRVAVDCARCVARRREQP